MLPTETKYCKPSLLPHRDINLFDNGAGGFFTAVDDHTVADMNKRFEYENLTTGQNCKVSTPEEVENNFKSSTEPTAEAPTLENPSKEHSAPVKHKPAELVGTNIEIRENQRGVTYKTIFGDYIKGVHNVKIVAPFIRHPHQVVNLLEFIQTIREANEEENLKIVLHTLNDNEHIPDMIDHFHEIKDDLLNYNIEFEYFFDADHDRKVGLDNGWTVIMGRWLDIYGRPQNYSLESIRRELQRCKACNFTFMKG